MNYHYEKEGGLKWPVSSGDVWKSGPHIFGCGDHESGMFADFSYFFGPPDMAYVDPPWNQGNASTFRTKAEVEKRADFQKLIVAVINATRHVTGPVFMEMGKKEEANVICWAEREGMKVYQSWEIMYYRKYPARLLYMGWDSEAAPVQFTLSPEGMDDEDTPKWAMQEIQPRTVLDPCMGRGGTAVAAHRLGIDSIGFELNPKRLSVTLEKLNKLGLAPERIRVDRLGSRHSDWVSLEDHDYGT